MDFFINTANAQAAGAGGGQSMLSALLLPVLLLALEIASGVNVKLQKFQVAQVLPKGTVKSA
jgi:hypothetical protein